MVAPTFLPTLPPHSECFFGRWQKTTAATLQKNKNPPRVRDGLTFPIVALASYFWILRGRDRDICMDTILAISTSCRNILKKLRSPRSFLQNYIKFRLRHFEAMKKYFFFFSCGGDLKVKQTKGRERRASSQITSGQRLHRITKTNKGR